jgi:hypothetical protein
MCAVPAYCSRHLKPTLLAGIVGYSQPAHFGFRVYNLVLCEGYVLTRCLDPIDVIRVCPTSRPITEFRSVEYKDSLLTLTTSKPIGLTSLPLYADSSH